MAEVRVIKFRTHGSRLSRTAKWMINHPQKRHGCAHVTYFCMRNCGL